MSHIKRLTKSKIEREFVRKPNIFISGFHHNVDEIST
jgi:hypothetical protein